MPLIINEVVSDIRIASGSQESGKQGASPAANPELDRVERLLAALRGDAQRLTGRDEDDPPGALP
ncbi:MAG: hypothetical protein ACR652_05220 [Methylocystis sp.]|uniref:hypothetical protein n=1 Tax=Methylocystis sp. TaxID=1911079 RepID=UPI003DA23950